MKSKNSLKKLSRSQGGRSNMKIKALEPKRIEKLLKKKEQKAVNLMIDATLLKRFKLKTVTENTTMTEIIIDSIEAYLK